jgi:AcrR family transcriptional regulator
MATSRSDGSVRDRLLEAANELFYQEGVRSVGIDRVLDRAGVAKASLYDTFGSKDELVRAYLEKRSMTRRERIAQRIAQHTEPRARLLSVFDLLHEIVSEPTFRGCAFVNASAEGPRGESAIRKVCADQRRWVRDLFTELARDAGARDAERLGRRLALLYDGVMTGGSMDAEASVAGEAKGIAETLLDVSTKARSAVNGRAEQDSRKSARTRARGIRA